MAALTEERLDTAVGKVQVVRGGSGRPVVYLHSANGETGVGLPLLEALADTVDVVAPIFPGFGESEGIDAIDDMEDATYHLLDVLDRLGLEAPALVGLSLGGWMAAEIASRYPDRVSALVLVNPVGLYLPEAPVPDIFRGRGDELAELLFADQTHPMAQMMHAMAEGIEDPMVVAQIPFEMVKPMLQSMAATAKLGWDPYLHDPKLPKRLPRVTAPTLVVRGGADALLAEAHADRYAELVPNARRADVDGAGHLLTLERPDELARLITDFLG
jgi:pimeloyl-ACP methyl ester carboxylesterase